MPLSGSPSGTTAQEPPRPHRARRRTPSKVSCIVEQHRGGQTLAEELAPGLSVAESLLLDVVLGDDYAICALASAGAYIDDVDGNSRLLYHAVSSGHSRVVRLLLMLGVNASARPASKPLTPLLLAIWVRDIDVTKLLLSHDADVTCLPSGGVSAVRMACYVKTTDTLRVVLSAGAHVDLCGDDRWTGLHEACYSKSLTCARALLDPVLGQRRANVGRSDRVGNRPLYISSARSSLDTVDVLIEKGADVMQAAMDGTLAVLAAAANEHCGVAHRLWNHTTNVDNLTVLRVASNHCMGSVSKFLLSIKVESSS